VPCFGKGTQKKMFKGPCEHVFHGWGGRGGVRTGAGGAPAVEEDSDFCKKEAEFIQQDKVGGLDFDVKRGKRVSGTQALDGT